MSSADDARLEELTAELAKIDQKFVAMLALRLDDPPERAALEARLEEIENEIAAITERKVLGA